MKVAIIGAGVGGLAAAILLAARGVEVTVCEAAPQPGGKLRAVTLGQMVMDTGPTLLTLRSVFEEIFSAGGSKLDAHLALAPVSVLGRHVWPDGSALDLHLDEARNEAAIGEFAGAAEARAYRGFARRAREVHATLERGFLRNPRPTALGLAAEVGMARLLGISPFSALGEVLEGSFGDPRLRQLFGRYATYVGAAPPLAPATLMLVAEVEREGVWRVEGGVARLAAAMARVAQGLGATLRCDARVLQIEGQNGRAVGLRLADGEIIRADAVIANADVASLGAGRLGALAASAVGAVAPRKRSFSAVTWAMAARLAGREALHTNVIFPPPDAGEFTDLVYRGRIPPLSTLHLVAQDRAEDAPSPQGDERVLISMSAPARGDAAPMTRDALLRLTEMRFAQLAHAGFEVHPDPERIEVTTPADFERLYPGTGGALYGPAMHGWSAAFERPRASTRVPGLFLAGGGTHPGAGLAMSALSGRFAAEAVLKEKR
jgi:1-hydroxycarotenoid 3,4-desaturase